MNLPEAGAYEIGNMLPGNYIIEAYVDSDGNGLYTYGKPDPFQFAERFAVFPDTVNIRPRWIKEGNHF